MKLSAQLFNMIWTGIIVFCLVLSVFSVVFTSCAKVEGGETADITDGDFIQREDEPEEIDQEPVPTPKPPVRLQLTEDMGREYLDKLIFLGDSTTYGIGFYYNLGFEELCPPSQVWTPKSGTLTLAYYNVATIVYPATEEEISIEEAVKRAKPEIMVLTVGVNGIAFMDEAWFKRDYASLVQMIHAASPDTKIILNSIYPVAASYPYQKDINNSKITDANVWIEQIATDNDCRFLYSHECVVGPDGYLPETSQNGDGIHLTGEAYTTVMQYIRTHAWQ